MGVQARVVAYAADAESARDAALAAFARIAAIDLALSDYRVDSEIARLASQESLDHPGVDLIAVLEASRLVHDASGGDFDPTLAPLTRLWRRSRDTRELPGPAELAAARARVGLARVRASPDRIDLEPGMSLDFGAIAKGYAAHQARDELARAGCPRSLVSLGGDVAAGDPPPGARAWSIASDHPGSPTIRLARASISTSGDAYQTIEIAGERYAHVIDPRTGVGAPRLWLASVAGPDGALADALATVVSLRGPEGWEFLRARFPAYRAWITPAR